MIMKWTTNLTSEFTAKKKRRELPSLTPNLFEWSRIERPNLGTRPRDFKLEKYWDDIYQDESTQIVLANARQTWKTTFFTDNIGCYTTSRPGCEVLYIVDRPDRLALVSKQRVRKEVFFDNGNLNKFLINEKADIQNFYLANGSVITFRTHLHKYNNAQGMSAVIALFDECQFQDLQYRGYALETLQHTGERFIYAGVGGEEGSEWHNMWLDSKQFYWEWDVKGDYDYFDEVLQDDVIVKQSRTWPNMGVRNLLKFDEDGNIINTPEELEVIRAGKWVAKNPHGDYPGYNITQEMMLRTPLTISDAKYKYKKPTEMSIQHKLITLPKRLQATQVYGRFVHTPRIPITQKMVQDCFDSTKSFLTPEQVKEIKSQNKGNVFVFLGIDWGSGKSLRSSTVGTVTIYWKNTRQFQLADVDVDPITQNKGDQAFHFIKKFQDYDCDFCVADLGHGEIQVGYLQDGAYRSDGKKFVGLGRTKVRGCRTTGGIEKPEEEFKQENDEHGKTIDHITVYKTDIIEEYIDLFESKTINTNDTHISPVLSRLIIPTKDNHPVIHDIQKQSCGIKRADIKADAEEEIVDDKSQSSEKTYQHPPDIPMSIMYNQIAQKNYDPDPFYIHKIKKTNRRSFGRRR